MRLLRRSPITPIHLSLAALASGIVAAAGIARGTRSGFLAGAVLLQLKNIFDTADGHLARTRGKPSYVGRYLDSLVDFTVNVASHAALAAALVRRGWPASASWPLAALASLSAFLQCSTYVYYTVTYLHRTGRSPVSRTDERAEPPWGGEGGRESARWVRWLHRVHVLLYGWQDDLVEAVDRRGLARLAGRLGGENDVQLAEAWYDNRRELTRLSVLGLGTQLAAMSLALALDRPELYLILVIGVGNAYLLALYPARAAATRRAWRHRAVPDQASPIFRQPPAP